MEGIGHGKDREERKGHIRLDHTGTDADAGAQEAALALLRRLPQTLAEALAERG